MKLTVNIYNKQEQEGKKLLPNRFLEAFQPEVFKTVGFPTTIDNENSVFFYLDSMHDGRTKLYCETNHMAPTQKEWTDILWLSQSINEISKKTFDRELVVKAPLICAQNALRTVESVSKLEQKPTIFEIGGGVRCPRRAAA